MKRITAEEVIEAYKKTDAQPMRRGWYSTSGVRCRACALTAMAMAKVPEFIEQCAYGTGFVKPICEALNISYEYLDGFTRAYDGYDIEEDFKEPDYLKGYEDGKAAGEAVDKQILYPGVRINAEDHS